MTAAQRRRLERREQLLERYEGASQTFADALAVLEALTCWVKDTATTAVKAMAARDKAKDALEAHLARTIATDAKGHRATGDVRGAIDALAKSADRAGASVDAMLDFVQESNRRIDEMERKKNNNTSDGNRGRQLR
jgi:hypothetical protein